MKILHSVNFVNEDDNKKYSSTNLFSMRLDVDELKWLSDDKNYDEMFAAPSVTRRDRTKLLFEDYRTFKIHPIG